MIFSGGKALRGPQSSGLLLGRKDLIEAALPAMSPFGGIGRGMKVGKEELCGLLAAVERYLKVDHEAEYRELEARVDVDSRGAEGRFRRSDGSPCARDRQRSAARYGAVGRIRPRANSAAGQSRSCRREIPDPRAAARERATADLRLDDARRRTQDRRPALREILSA